jgi:hypothetical protein
MDRKVCKNLLHVISIWTVRERFEEDRFGASIFEAPESDSIIQSGTGCCRVYLMNYCFLYVNYHPTLSSITSRRETTSPLRGPIFS